MIWQVKHQTGAKRRSSVMGFNLPAVTFSYWLSLLNFLLSVLDGHSAESRLPRCPVRPASIPRTGQQEEPDWAEALEWSVFTFRCHSARVVPPANSRIYRGFNTEKLKHLKMISQDLHSQGILLTGFLNPVQRFNNTLENAVWSTRIQVHRFNNHWHRPAALSLFYFTEGSLSLKTITIKREHSCASWNIYLIT